MAKNNIKCDICGEICGDTFERLPNGEARCKACYILGRGAGRGLKTPGDLLNEAFDGISERKRMRTLIKLFRNEKTISLYLYKLGMTDADLRAMFSETLRGTDVARHLYLGMLEGLKNGLDRLNQRDAEAVKEVTKWTGDENA